MPRTSLALVFLVAITAGTSHAAPLHPDLRQDHSLPDRPPPEPLVRSAATSTGVLGAATQFGRRWAASPRVLVLMADFSDRPADPATHDSGYFQQLLFSEDEMEFGSLRDWYREVSYERLDVTGEVHGWYRMPLTYAQYANDASGLCGNCTPANAKGLAGHAVDAALADGVDFTRFDNDGPDGVPGSGDDDGIIDALIIVFAGIGAERTGSKSDLRSHYWDMAFNQQVQGIRLPDYAMIPERENVGIAVHEFGHVLGGEDLYDTSNRGVGLGDFSVMAHGIWFNNGRSPGRPDPFTLIQWGFLDPEVPGADEPRFLIPAVADEPYVLRLWTRGEVGPEYFLVENRRPGGIDRFLAGDGLLIYHVDERVRSQNNPGKYRVAVIQADGLRSLEGNDPRSRGDAGDFFPGRDDVRVLDDMTDPGSRSHDGTETLVAIRNIGDPGPELPVSIEVGRFIAGGPQPRLDVLPDGGVYVGEVAPGNPTGIQLRILNRGTRLDEGELTIVSRAFGVDLGSPAVVEMMSIAALDSRRVPESIEVTVEENRTSRMPVPIEVAWETPEATYRMAAPLPMAEAVVRREGFEEGSPDIDAFSLTLKDDPWHRQQASAREGNWAWSTSGYAASADAVLQVGPVYLKGVSELRFEQIMNAQAFGEYASDGGFLEASVDGGTTWERLTPNGGYPTTFTLTEGNNYPGVPAWSGRGEEWEEIVVPLRMEGETWFRFHFVSDFTGSNGIYAGWFVDQLIIRSWDHTHAAVFDEPIIDEELVTIGFSVIPMFEIENPGRVMLKRETGIGFDDLGIWEFGERLDVSVEVPGLSPGQTDRYWIAWEDPALEPTGPLVISSPPTPGEAILRVSPSPIRRSEDGWIAYRVPGVEAATVRVDLHDVRGALVNRLTDGTQLPGPYQIRWPQRSDTGKPLGAGVYFLKIEGEGFRESRRVVLLP